jgi:flagellar protein FlgJ
MSNSNFISSLPTTDGTEKLAADANSLNELRRNVAQNTPESVKATAKQFEALFVNMMLKSMREATPQDGPFDNEQSKTFTSMLDQQLSQKIASRGIGLAEVLEKQMMGSALQFTSKQGTSGIVDPTTITQQAKNLQAISPGLNNSQAQVKAFQSKLTAIAEQTSLSTGIPAKFMLGQAALESGWGKHEIIATNGQPSHNLFGIKAGKNWTGKVVSAVTTEYVNGVATKKTEKFRAYDNYDEAFNDYAKLLQGNDRYKNVIANAKDAYSFAHGLQKAGYASDPNYANKLMHVITKTLSA